eukprot:359060-Chlamydomonas_euryale.AAC.7
MEGRWQGRQREGPLPRPGRIVPSRLLSLRSQRASAAGSTAAGNACTWKDHRPVRVHDRGAGPPRLPVAGHARSGPSGSGERMADSVQVQRNSCAAFFLTFPRPLPSRPPPAAPGPAA